MADRRSSRKTRSRMHTELQLADPYKSGDPFWLDGMEDGDGFGD